MDTSHIDPLKLFKEELANEELKIRVNTIRRLPIILNNLPQSQENKDKLLSILNDILQTSEDDEVIFGLAESFSSLMQLYKFP